jgi:hypothetical protein
LRFFMNNCDITRRLLPEYIDHSLSERDSDNLESHLSACPACRTELRQLLEVVEAAKGLRKGEPQENKRSPIYGWHTPLSGVVVGLVVSVVLGILLIVAAKSLAPKPKSQDLAFVVSPDTTSVIFSKNISETAAPVLPVAQAPFSGKEIVISPIIQAMAIPVEKDVIDVYSQDPASALVKIRDTLIADGFILVSLDNQQLPYLVLFIAPSAKTAGLAEKISALVVGEVRSSPFSIDQEHEITFSIRIHNNH